MLFDNTLFHDSVLKFRCDLMYLRCTLVTVVCPCAPWCWIHDIHIWWTSYVYSTVKGKVTKVRPIILSYATFHSFPVTVECDTFLLSAFLWKLFPLVVVHYFLLRAEIFCVLSVLCRFENRRRVWEWKSDRTFHFGIYFTTFPRPPEKRTVLPFRTPPFHFFHLVTTTFVRFRETSFFPIVSQSSREQYVLFHWKQFVWKRKLTIFCDAAVSSKRDKRYPAKRHSASIRYWVTARK